MIKINSLIIALIACSVFVTSLNAVPKSQEALFKEYKSKKVLLKEELAQLKWKLHKNCMYSVVALCSSCFLLKTVFSSLNNNAPLVNQLLAGSAIYAIMECWFDFERNIEDEISNVRKEIRDLEEKLQQA
jgi:peptidoglycan hydrolase CwlO-like protein